MKHWLARKLRGLAARLEPDELAGMTITYAPYLEQGWTPTTCTTDTTHGYTTR